MSAEKDRWEFYSDKRDKWRWRRLSSNGKIVGASTEGYAKRADCENNAKRNGWVSGQVHTSDAEK